MTRGPDDNPLCRRALRAMGIVLLLSTVMIGYFVLLEGPADSPCLARGNCYCEPMREALIRQPMNTWSSLVFLPLGFWTLWAFCKQSARTPDRPDLAVLYVFPAILTWLGPAAFVFHMTLRFDAGVFDQTSIVILITFAALFNVQRVFGVPSRGSTFLRLYIPSALLFAGATVVSNSLRLRAGSWGVSDVIVAILGTTTIVFTVASWSGKRRPRCFGEHPSPARVAFPVTMAAALLVWTASQSGGPLCGGGQAPIGHAAWHVTAALALAAAFWGWLAHPRHGPGDQHS